jgi:hypothetical protein
MPKRRLTQLALIVDARTSRAEALERLLGLATLGANVDDRSNRRFDVGPRDSFAPKIVADALASVTRAQEPVTNEALGESIVVKQAEFHESFDYRFDLVERELS